MSDRAQPVSARVGSIGVYATAAALDVWRRTRSERVVRAVFTLLGCWLLAPFAFMIPPYLEPGLVALLVGVYFARRAWVGEWVVERMSGACPRCDASMALKEGSVLYLPHTLRCSACGVECWLELEPAPAVDEALRRAALEAVAQQPAGELGGRPPLTWSPAASDWRDRAK
jgi:hypothetical protein